MLPARSVATIVLAVLLVPGCDRGEEAMRDKPERSEEVLAHGEDVYERNCARCHGLEGKGDGPSRGLAVPKPRDFTRKTFKYTSTGTGIPTEKDLYKTVSRGIPGTQMTAMEGALSEYERWAAVYHVQRLGGIDLEKPVPAAIPPIPTATDTKKGSRTYLAQCAKCHGTTGAGDGTEADTLTDDNGDLIRPRNLVADALAGGEDPEAIYLRVKYGIRGTKMVPPDGYASLSDAEVWDVVAYIQELRGKKMP